MKNPLNLFVCILIIVLVISSCQHEPLFDDLQPDNPIDTTGMGGSNPCDPDSVYFENDILPILQSNCAFSGCHGNGSSQNGVELNNYTNIINTADVRPFDLDGSDLYEVITETDPDNKMPPPTNNSLSNSQINLIAQWINQGALNNKCDDCDTTSVTFNSTIKLLIQNNCQGCHSGGSPSGNVLLTNHSEIQVQALSGSLYGAVSHQLGYVPMPYNQPPLDSCKIDQIRIWIEEGALNN